jgi:arylsulfatase A-like enzyme
MNVVLLTIDSLRADYASPDQGLMPSLTDCANDGVQFTQAYSNGYATPVSFPTILTGTYATRFSGWGYMADERPFLAAAFDDAGYETAAVHSNPHLRADKNYDTGFDFYNEFKDDAGSLSRLRYLVTETVDEDSRLYKYLRRAYHYFRTSSGSTDYADAPEINERAFEWLDGHWSGEKPFFLWAHYMDPHYPFYPPSEFRDDDRSVSTSRAVTLNGKMHEESDQLTERDVADLRHLYRGDVRYTDYHFGRLVEGLRERDLYDDTVFVVTSDHGEMFGEHGQYGHPPSVSNEILHVPLIVFGPGLPSDVTVSSTCSLVDLPPTLADVCDLSMADAWDGKSLCPLAQSGDGDDRSFVAGDEDVLAFQADGWRLAKWRETTNPRDPAREWELWSVETGEPVSLETNQSVAESLQSELEAYIAEAEGEEQLEEPDVDEDIASQLDALGYR